MIINKKKYEKLNNDLVDIKVKAFNDVKKALDGENKIMRLCLQIKEQRDQYKAERDTLIDDLKVLREKNEELKEEMTRLHEESNITVFCALMEENSELKKENEKLMVVSIHYTTLTNHIRLKAENNPGVSRYIDLVNYIDRLERD
ncbi:hypothetical protein [Staphylococcus pseudoxylosus]|uniref:hypothetical protein n=1 Tax=Staphylococcus pseudoxylosus TaxID=2282419 RepID=UPI00301980DE